MKCIVCKKEGCNTRHELRQKNSIFRAVFQPVFLPPLEERKERIAQMFKPKPLFAEK